MFEACNPLYIPTYSVILPVKEKGDFIAQIRIKITDGHRAETRLNEIKQS